MRQNCLSFSISSFKSRLGVDLHGRSMEFQPETKSQTKSNKLLSTLSSLSLSSKKITTKTLVYNHQKKNAEENSTNVRKIYKKK